MVLSFFFTKQQRIKKINAGVCREQQVFLKFWKENLLVSRNFF